MCHIYMKYISCLFQDRLWRKTMTPQGRCRGVDPNRNFDIDFGGTMTF